MDDLSEVCELLLIDQSKVTSESICPEETLSAILQRIEQVTDSLRSEISSISARESAINVALAYNSSQSKLWGERAPMAADDGLNHLTHEALKWKREHEEIIVALRDEQVEVCQLLNVMQHKLTAIQAAGAHARRRLEMLAVQK